MTDLVATNFQDTMMAKGSPNDPVHAEWQKEGKHSETLREEQHDRSIHIQGEHF